MAECRPCQIISCPPENDYSLYSLQGVSDTSPPSNASPFSNEQLFYSGCEGDLALASGTLPFNEFTCVVDTVSWLVIDQRSSGAIILPGAFRGPTQEAANQAALAAAAEYISTQLSSGALVCRLQRCAASIPP